MQPLNYCRQMTQELLAQVRSGYRMNSAHGIDTAISLAQHSTKFMLPPGGVLIDDKEFRAIDESEPLRLPYPAIALEFQMPEAFGRKFIVFAEDLGEKIRIFRAQWLYSERDKQPIGWFVGMDANECRSIPKTNYLDRSRRPNGMPTILYEKDNSREELDEPIDDPFVLLCFLNALNCSNVSIASSQPKKGRVKAKDALPFDTYHVLMIETPGAAPGASGLGGSHRSPREHLRRGHIRRLSDGRRLWVNATVVAAGRGAGVVTKDYAMRRAK
jgi:hypothetical protein